MGIHPTAIVDEDAEIGPETEIGPFCVIHRGVRIGANCHLHSHVVIDGDTRVGDHCEIYPFAVLGTRPQDKKLSRDFRGVLRVGSHNQIREYVTIHGGTEFGRGLTEVGDHNMLLASSHVGHDARVGDHTVFTNGAMAAGHTEIQDHAILGALVGVHQFGRVGSYAMIGAGAMLSHDAPPFALVQGDRARLVGVNKVGLARSGFTTEQIMVIKRVFRLLFWRRGVLSKRLAEARAYAGDEPHAHQIMDFVAASERGICATRGRTSRIGEDRGGDDSAIDDPASDSAGAER